MTIQEIRDMVSRLNNERNDQIQIRSEADKSARAIDKQVRALEQTLLKMMLDQTTETKRMTDHNQQMAAQYAAAAKAPQPPDPGANERDTNGQVWNDFPPQPKKPRKPRKKLEPAPIQPLPEGQPASTIDIDTPVPYHLPPTG